MPSFVTVLFIGKPATSSAFYGDQADIPLQTHSSICFECTTKVSLQKKRVYEAISVRRPIGEAESSCLSEMPI